VPAATAGLIPRSGQDGASRGQADCVGSATALPLGRWRIQETPAGW